VKAVYAHQTCIAAVIQKRKKDTQKRKKASHKHEN
jgi:hypothetical protein